MKKSKKLLIRYIEFFLKKYFFTSIYPFFVFVRTRKTFKKKINIKKNFNRFSNNLSKINNSEFKITSQNNEDGIIEHIFKKIPHKKYFVEIGFGYYECNTLNLIKNNWSGRLIDSSIEETLAMRLNLNYFFSKPKVNIIHFKVTKYNINNIVFSDTFSSDIDFLSLDIDGNDYWVIKSLISSKIKVICIEYNHWLGANTRLAMKYDPNFNFVDNGIFGASLLAFTEMLKEKHFSLVAVDSSGTNAFYVNNIFAESFEILCPIKNFISVGRFYSELKKKEILENIKKSDLFIKV